MGAVVARGVEPRSEMASKKASTCVAAYLVPSCELRPQALNTPEFVNLVQPKVNYALKRTSLLKVILP